MPGRKERPPSHEMGPHPLEGKYVVVNMTQCDLEQESTIPLLCHVTGGIWRAVAEPGWDEIHYEEMVLQNFERDLKAIKAKGVNEIFVPKWHGGYFLGSNTFIDMDDSKTFATRKQTEQWIEYEPLWDPTGSDLEEIADRIGLKICEYQATDADQTPKS